MKLHANARTCPNSRRLLVKRIEAEGWSLTEAAEAAGVSERTAAKWRARWRTDGEAGLLDRSSRPRRSPCQTPAERVAAIEALRRLRMTAAEISEVMGTPLSTVSRVLRRSGLGKLSRLCPPEPIVRYERQRPGELLHIDVKKLGRIGPAGAGHRVTGSKRLQARRDRKPGWECCHVAVDDATRLAYVEVLATERASDAIAFLERALAFFSGHGVAVERVMTDNGSAYVSAAYALACRELGLRHLRTRPRRPETNGKAERFIQTMLREWAYGRIYRSSSERTSQLKPWLLRYNWRRRHGALGHKTPAQRLAELNDVVRNDS